MTLKEYIVRQIEERKGKFEEKDLQIIHQNVLKRFEKEDPVLYECLEEATPDDTAFFLLGYIDRVIREECDEYQQELIAQRHRAQEKSPEECLLTFFRLLAKDVEARKQDGMMQENSANDSNKKGDD